MKSNMCRIAMMFTAALLALSLTASAQQKPEEAAQEAASGWLSLVDNGKYTESWQPAAELFRNAVSAEQWQHSLHAVRGPLGKLGSRKVISATYTKTLPGAPDGE